MDIEKIAGTYGFSVDRIRENAFLGGSLVEMTHKKTGAQLCWLDNKEENKLFSVAFKTTPENSTGVFHILEHSVLCGSEKFQVREPFVELLKSSMNTFLNAMTYPDKTLYPVSSRNERDFLNLTEVYLDAVFQPLLLKKPSVFYQEGWHYELSDDGNCYNGVVFNEMKGATSGVDERAEYALLDLMFPDNCYHYNSGGDPSVIPDLTYDMFVDTYKRYYHPSNSRFFLDGDIPLDATLKLISSYLDKYEKSSINPVIKPQKPVSRQGKIYYGVDKIKENSDVIVYGKILCDYSDGVKIAATNVLCDFLASSNESPLKKALLSKGICEDVELFVNGDMYQPFVMLVVRNTSADKAEEIRKTINDVISTILKNGIDEKELIASLNKTEYQAKQLPEPQALYRASNALSSWLYGGDPMLYLDIDSVYKAVRELIGTSAFDDILNQVFIDSANWSRVVAKPSVTVDADEENARSQRLEAELKAMTQEQTKKIAADKAALDTWQQTPDSKQALESLPSLELSEVNPVPELISTEVGSVDGVTVLYHKLSTNGVVHFSMYFPLTSLSLRELAFAASVQMLLGELPTEKYDVAQLQREVKTYIGQLDFSLSSYSSAENSSQCMPCLVVRASALKENLSRAQELVTEIINRTKFDDKAKIFEIIKQYDEEGRRSAIGNGHILGMLSVRAGYSAQGAVSEALSGYTNIKIIHQLANDFDGGYDEYIAAVKKAMSLAGKGSVTVSYTNDEKIDISALISLLGNSEPVPMQAEYKTDLPHRMGIKIPSQVSYAVKGCDLTESNLPNDGSMRVAAKILTFSYLWNKVRVQGGAYGTGLSVDRNGGYILYSYRDPSPAASLAAYDKCAEYLAEFADDDTEKLDNFIISTLGANDPLVSPRQKGFSADDFYFSNWTDENRINNRKQMLQTTRQGLKLWCKALDDCAQNGAVCVVGNEEALNSVENIEIFEL